MRKHLPEKSFLKNQKTMLYSKKEIVYNKTKNHRKTYNSTTPADITDENIDGRTTFF